MDRLAVMQTVNSLFAEGQVQSVETLVFASVSGRSSLTGWLFPFLLRNRALKSGRGEWRQ